MSIKFHLKYFKVSMHSLTQCYTAWVKVPMNTYLTQYSKFRKEIYNCVQYYLYPLKCVRFCILRHQKMKQSEDYFTMPFQIIASQDDKGWKESLEVTCSNICSAQGQYRSGCSGLCPLKFGISPSQEIQQHLWQLLTVFEAFFRLFNMWITAEVVTIRHIFCFDT